MAYLEDITRNALLGNSLRPINLEDSRPMTQNYLIGKSKYCNIIIPEGYKYTAKYHAIISSVLNLANGQLDVYLGDLRTKGRTVVERKIDSDFKSLNPVEDHDVENSEKFKLEPAISASKIFKLQDKDCLTFGSEKYEKYRINYQNGDFVNFKFNPDLDSVVNKEILTYVIGNTDLASITVPNRIRNFEVKNVDLFHVAIVGYKNDGKRKWGVIDLGTNGKTHMRRKGLIENIKSYEDLEDEDEINTEKKFTDYKYSIFKLEHGDEILLNGVEEEDLRDAYKFKFLENLEAK